MSDTTTNEGSLRRVADVGDIDEGDSSIVELDDRKVAVFHVDGEYFALDNVCPHQGGPLGQGRIEDKCVYCPWHGWQFDIETGSHVQGEETVGTYEVVVGDDEIYLRL